MVALAPADVDEFVGLRRDIHRHPELGLAEQRTSQLVAARLEAWGYEVTRGLGGTGVVGRLQLGDGPRRLGLRADMDALPIEEQGDCAWASTNRGVMHACGHDGHVVMLLAAAKQLAARRAISGTLHLIFQPAEENAGGARLMIEDGLFERFACDAIYAMHNMPRVPQGHFVFLDGPALASSDDVTITLTGRGGHAAMPHEAADPIVAAASVVLALQTVVSRNVDPRHAAVVTVGALEAGRASNVIPERARLEVSVRALDRDVRDLLERRIRELVEAQATSFGVSATVDYVRGYPVLVNTPAETELARQVAAELVGEDAITRQGKPLTGSEDFAYMLDHCPGSLVVIGNGEGCMVHDPRYDFNDDNITVGASFWTLLAERYLTAS